MIDGILTAHMCILYYIDQLRVYTYNISYIIHCLYDNNNICLIIIIICDPRGTGSYSKHNSPMV